MKILVGIKHVPDTEAKVRVGPDGSGLDEAGVKWIMSPFDEYALKQALLIRDETPGEVVIVSAGREKAQDSLRLGLAFGASDEEAARLPASEEPALIAAIRQPFLIR